MRGFKWHTYGILMLAIAACGKDSSSPQIQPELSIVAGDVQIDTVGKTLPTELGAKLTDKNSGLPLPGRVINWVVLEGGGQTFVSVSQTASDGVARNTWTLGTLAGGQKLVARWLDPETGDPVTLDTAIATAVPANAASIALPGATDTSVARSQLTNGSWILVEFRYVDQFGNRTWACSGPASPANWSWQYNSINVPNPPLLIPLDTTVIDDAGHHFAVLNVDYAAQPSTWAGTQITVLTAGCAARAQDSVIIHYDNVQ
jgi:hypothetical protein